MPKVTKGWFYFSVAWYYGDNDFIIQAFDFFACSDAAHMICNTWYSFLCDLWYKMCFFFCNWMNAAAWLPYWLPYINFVWVGHMILKPQQADTTFLFQGYTNHINLPANTKLYGVLHQGTVHIVLQIKWCIYGSFIAKALCCILMCLIVCAVFSSMYTKVTCLVYMLMMHCKGDWCMGDAAYWLLFELDVWIEVLFLVIYTVFK